MLSACCQVAGACLHCTFSWCSCCRAKSRQVCLISAACSCACKKRRCCARAYHTPDCWRRLVVAQVEEGEWCVTPAGGRQAFSQRLCVWWCCVARGRRGVCSLWWQAMQQRKWCPGAGLLPCMMSVPEGQLPVLYCLVHTSSVPPRCCVGGCSQQLARCHYTMYLRSRRLRREEAACLPSQQGMCLAIA